MNQTIILRFRDLVTQPGETILRHRSIIEKYSYVWWGWWKRSYEEIPCKTFNEIEKPSTTFLLDTGGEGEGLHLYKANLVDIAVTPTGLPIQSPEPGATPTYYNNNWLPVWYKFDSIDEEKIENNMSLIIEDLPTWPSINKTEIQGLIGRKVSSQQELRQVDVTLWVVKIED